MLKKIIEFSVRNKLIVAMLVIALLATGLYQATQLPIDAVPDITNNQVQIITTAPSFGAADIERLVTYPIEQANSNISGIKEMRSFSRFGLSLVTIVFEDNVDIYWARQQVNERLQQIQADIPTNIGTPVLGPISTGLGEIYQYVVRPQKGFEKKYTLTDLRTIQDWVVRRQLLGVKGVAEVSSFGGKLKQFEVAIMPDRLNAYGITLSDLLNALQRNNQNTGGAYIERGPTTLFIRTEGLVGTVADIENISIATKNNEAPLFVRDVAKVNIGYATRFGAMTYNDEGEVAGAVVMMLKGENSSKVIKNVKKRIEEISHMLPKGVVIEPFLDRTKMVNNAIHTVEKNLLEGALIVVFVLVLFLGNLRAGLLVASVIPLSMLFAICMMNLFGVSGNLMSLGALDFGLIIDGAVIIVEAVMHSLMYDKRFISSYRIKKEEMNTTVTESASRMMSSAVFGQVIILVVYLPILTLQGIEGKMFKPMAQTVAFALLGAFLLSLTYIPMMSAFILKRHSNQGVSAQFMKRIESVYKNAIVYFIRRSKAVLASILVLFIISIFVLTQLGGEFIPSLEEGDFAVDTRVLTGSNLNVTIEQTQKAAHILKSRFPEVEKVVSKIGSGEVPTDPMPMEASDMMVILKDKSQWTTAHTFPKLADTMSRALNDIAGITTSFQYPVQMRFNELMTGARQDIVLKIFGEDLDTLAALAGRIGRIANRVQGAQNIYVEPIIGMPQVVVHYNRSALAQFHISVEEVNHVINAAFAGASAGLVFEGEKRFDLILRIDTTARKSVENVRQLLIPTPLGIQIPLEQFADVNIIQGPNQIQRENAHRRIIIGLNVHGRDMQSVVNDLRNMVDKEVALPTGYYMTYGGSFENLQQAKGRLAIAVPIALLLIFILLYFAFHSIRETLLIYTTIPLSIIGGVFFLALRGMPFSISAGVGFIALFGVAVLNGIVLVAEFNRLHKSGIKSLVKVVVQGARLRLRPVLMTASVASLGFLPMALSNGAGAEVQRPLATVVIGGLVLATLLTLFVIPILFLLFNKKNSPKALTVLILTIFSLSSASPTQAQQAITLDSAIHIALEKNQQLQSVRLKTNAAKALIKSSLDISPTSITAEYGQINSAYNDTRFGISQSISMPNVYLSQKRLFTEEWKKAQLFTSLNEWELKKIVSETFYQLKYWDQKEALLNKADSLFDNFLQRATIRLQKGESNILEKTTAEGYKGNIIVQLEQCRQSRIALQSALRFLLHTEVDFVPSGEMNFRNIEIRLTLLATPAYQLATQQQIVNERQIAIEQTKRTPSIFIGYSNNSFIGMGADDRIYNSQHRFHSAILGLSVPIWTTAQTARIKSAKINAQASGIEKEFVATALSTRETALEQLYQSQMTIVNFYEQSAIPNSATIFKTAQNQFAAGEINYLNYAILLNQSIDIQLKYLDALQTLRQTVVELTYLTPKY
ncbi:MAG: CusA/CzcA family heavy metal efflux RND transporter [Bacteroidetes bacterium]|nr:CusA/CzcA family heavy metal efflux RND transporter [Bacteroidota bacterium]